MLLRRLQLREQVRFANDALSHVRSELSVARHAEAALERIAVHVAHPGG
jgi:hypothetical protein